MNHAPPLMLLLAATLGGALLPAAQAAPVTEAQPAPAAAAPATEAPVAPVVDDSQGSQPLAPPPEAAPIQVQQEAQPAEAATATP